MFEVKHVPQVWFNAVYLHTANVQLTFFFPCRLDLEIMLKMFK